MAVELMAVWDMEISMMSHRCSDEIENELIFCFTTSDLLFSQNRRSHILGAKKETLEGNAYYYIINVNVNFTRLFGTAFGKRRRKKKQQCLVCVNLSLIFRVGR